MRKLKMQSSIAPLVAVLGILACSNGGGDGSRFAAPTGPSRIVTTSAVGDAGDRTANQGEVEICKDGDAGSFDVTAGGSTTHYDLADGECRVVAVDHTTLNNGKLSVSVTELTSATSTLQDVTITNIQDIVGGGGETSSSSVVTGATQTADINQFHGTLMVFRNLLNPPPEAVCDFITFGRLVTTINGKKVVISGNIGGNQPGGGILAEFHVEADGVDNHVANVDTYGPIASGPLSSLTNSRMSTGTAKNGVAVEVRMWDGGEPGKGTDIVYVKLNGVELLGPNGQYIDQGNMQYHSNCRGPKL